MLLVWLQGQESAVTKPSAAKISEKAARSITARLRMQESGYRFSKAMENPGFIGIEDIQNVLSAHGIFQF